MKTPKPKMFLLTGATACTLLLASCTVPELRDATERTFTLEPARTASILGDGESQNFGVCHAGSLDGRGGAPRMTTGHISLSGPGRVLEGSQMAGYEVNVQRGQSCHIRFLHTFQSAVFFDLSSLPPDATVAKATLRINDNLPSEFRDDISTVACTVFRLGEAEEDWVGGTFFGPSTLVPGSDGSRDEIASRPARRASGLFYRTGSGLDVSKTVFDWVKGTRTNYGFTITPDEAETDRVFRSMTEEGHYQCQSYMLEASLEVRVLVPDT